MTVRRAASTIAVALALALALGACTGDPPVAAPVPGPVASGAVAWIDCTEQARQINRQLPESLSAQCGKVTVPRDWNTPDNGETFDIAVMRLRSDRQTDKLGSVLTNFGGPGASGLAQLPHLAGDILNLATRFDLVTFDPRGVGQSASVKCIANEDLDASFGYEPDPVADADFQGAVAISRRIGESCSAKFGEQLTLYSTEQAARDMDAIRQALGEEKFDYLGYSYGTLLGAVYAQLFPDRIRAMVLDGAVDPQQSPVESSEGQAMGFERALTNFDAWCNQNARRCPIAPDARGAVERAIASAETSPARGDGGRLATSGWVFYSVVSALYYQPAWEYLARGIADLGRGDPTVTFLLADSYADRDANGDYGTLFDANNAVNCTDSESYPTVEQIRTLQSDWRAKYPLFGAPLAVGLLNCAVWPAKKDPYPVGPATGSPPIVVVGTVGDPATPYESTAKLAAMLGTGRVLTWEGEGHTAYPETACIRDAVDAYFIGLTVPAEGTRCPAR
jgi:pimeloyl-ACP methyl ester carboxylesterase